MAPGSKKSPISAPDRRLVGPGQIKDPPAAPGASDAVPNPAPDAPAEAEAERQIAFRFGLSAESRAAAYLVAKGYRIVARRFKTAVGEIDIVARRGRALVFVEVKARAGLDAAAEAVSERQRARIIAAAQAWLAKNPADVTAEIRFDVILIAPGKMPRHLAGAFDASA